MRRWQIPIELILSLNEHLGRNRVLTLLTVASIATSVALATGLEMSSRSVQAEMGRTADAIGGAAQVEVTAGSVGIPESLLEEVKEAPGVGAVSPVIETIFKLPGGNFPFNVLGIDLTADQGIRSYHIARAGLHVPDPLRLLVRPDAVIIAEPLARRLGRREGESFRVSSRVGDLELRIEGILEGEGLARAFGGQIAVMDVYSLQTLLGREGWIDRIDVVPASGADVDALVGELESRVAGRASARRSGVRTALFDRVLATLRLASLIVAGAGVVVACILSYATMSLSVDRRIPQLTVLRAAGLEASRVRRIIWLESALFAVVGTAMGIALGYLLSNSFVWLFSQIVRAMHGVDVSELDPSPVTLAVALLVGVVLALAGSIAPARRAGQRFSLDAVSESAAGRRRSFASPAGWVPLLVAVGVMAAAAFSAPAIPPLVRAMLLFASGLALLVVGLPSLLRLVPKALPAFERTVPNVGHLIGTAIASKPARFTLTVTAMAGIVSALLGVMIVVESFTASVVEWVEGRYPPAVLVTVGDPRGRWARSYVSAETTEIIRTTPGVRAVSERYAETILFRGEEVFVFGRTLIGMPDEAGLAIVGRGQASALDALMKGAVAISQNIATRFGISVGDLVTLDTPKGRRAFQVAALTNTFEIGGEIAIEMAVFDDLWKRNGSSALVVWTDPDRQRIVEDMRGRMAGRQDLFFTDTEEFGRLMRADVDRFKSLLYVVTNLALFLGGICTANLLISVVAERRKELALLRASGATAAQLVAVVLADGLLLSTTALAAGLALGYACSFPLTDVLADQYGYSLEHAVNLHDVALLAAGTTATALLAGLYPALSARRTLPSDVFAPE